MASRADDNRMNTQVNVDTLLAAPWRLREQVIHRLAEPAMIDTLAYVGHGLNRRRSAVLIPLSYFCNESSPKKNGPCLVLNKRSPLVRQPGDLCYPGGGLNPLDNLLYLLMRLPGFPLSDSDAFRRLRRRRPETAMRLTLSLAASLREAWEEMRLNPLRVRFLGALPSQQLVMFDHVIQPLVGWVTARQRYKPNWEVARIVHIPIKKLLNPDNYSVYRLRYDQAGAPVQKDFACFIHKDQEGEELLWGASFRMTMDFLRLVFGFIAPGMENLPIVHGKLGKGYLNGSRPAGRM